MYEINVPTEAEMSAFEQTWRKMQDALNAGSALESKFNALKSEMEQARAQFTIELEGLRQELHRVQSANIALDESLAINRQQRDRLQHELEDERSERNQKVRELETALHERNRHVSKLEQQLSDSNAWLESTRNDLCTARTEKDDAQLRVMELEEENTKMKEALDAINKALHPMQVVTEVPKAEEPRPSEPEHIPQLEGESDYQYFGRVGRYPSEREARAAAQPRTEGGQFANGDKPEAIAASKYEDMPF